MASVVAGGIDETPSLDVRAKANIEPTERLACDHRINVTKLCFFCF
jgi:hypothetical protein